jgi:opacity protein-like surface antigen
MKRFMFIALTMLSFAAIASAVDVPKVELFEGYSYFHRDSEGSSSAYNLNGWRESVAFNAHKNIGLVADVSGSYGSVANVDYKVHSFLFGPQFSLRSEKATPFVHALFGLTNSKASGTSVDTSENSFAMALGGGIDVNAGKRLAIRIVQADYFMTKMNDRTQNNFAISTGIVFRFGNSAK